MIYLLAILIATPLLYFLVKSKKSRSVLLALILGLTLTCGGITAFANAHVFGKIENYEKTKAETFKISDWDVEGYEYVGYIIKYKEPVDSTVGKDETANDVNTGGSNTPADPNNGGSNDPATPGPIDPNNGGSNDPVTPGTTDPNNGGATEPVNPGATNPSNPVEPSTPTEPEDPPAPQPPVIEVGTVKVIHIDSETKNEIIPSVVTQGNVGEAFTTSPADIPNFKLVKSPDAPNGTYEKVEIVKTYEYQLKRGSVIVKYINLNTNEEIQIPLELKKDAPVGEEYVANRINSIIKDEVEFILNDSEEALPKNEKGLVAEGITEIVYKYFMVPPPPPYDSGSHADDD